MKKIFMCSLMLTSLFFVACTKTTTVTSPPTNPNPIIGLWVGTYQIDNEANLGSYYYSFSLFSDSTFVQQGGGSNGQIWTGIGTWSLKGTAWSATLSNTDISSGPLTQVVTATYDSVAGTLSHGVWRNTSGTSAAGTFSLKRVN
ncbi:MAG: hypothetical protein ABUM51_00460 [Bacteroidota bacterium]